MKTLRLFLCLLLIAFALMCTGCMGSKKVFNSKTESRKSDSSSVKSDSVKLTKINRAIDDEFTVKVAQSSSNNKSLDSLVNAKVDEILRQINTTKQSGGNSYKLYYDDVLRAVRAEFKLAETKDENLSTNKETATSSNEVLTTDQQVERVIYALPWWVWAIVAFFALPKIIDVFTKLTPVGAAVGTIFKKR